MVSRQYINVDINKNPHLAQLQYLHKKHPLKVKYNKFDSLPRLLKNDAPRRSYKHVGHNKRSVLHWGQRKLFLSEIEFLTLFYDNTNKLVVYAGSAPGTHITALSAMFPKYYFYLVDPAKFNIKETKHIKIINDFFTNETIKTIKDVYKDIEILFISDIRTGDPKVLNFEQIEKAVKEDQNHQMEWVKLLCPRAAILKYRLPWDNKITSYLKGYIYLPVWGRETTTETRLIIINEDNFENIDYDNKKYEEQLSYFNRITRVQYYDQGIYEGLISYMDHCYDCVAELYILDKYMKKVLNITNEDLLKKYMVKFVNGLNKACSKSGRTLSTKETYANRIKWFDGVSYDYKNKKINVIVDGSKNKKKKTKYKKHINNH